MQGSRLYVGNLGYSVVSSELETLFSSHGEVTQVSVIEGKGFGFVEMANAADAEKAKDALDGQEFQGRTLKVDEARPRTNREGSRSGSGYRRY
ncbi:MAG: RNA-binding protein [Candidatus Eisenbacteria bacterium]|nr:RNA-binding protein [Candidatus Eisenbacteria bacterium]